MYDLLLSTGVALFFTIVGTPLFARLFRRIGWGQYINADGQKTHEMKKGTPTMGGIVFIVGAVLGYFVGHWVTRDPLTASGLLVIYLMVGLGVVGFIDDFIKTHRRRSLGLSELGKVIGQVVIAAGFAVLALGFPDAHGTTPASMFISGVRDIDWLDLGHFGAVAGIILFAIWVVLLTVSTSNGVNLTDGLDGLATGSSIFAFVAYIVIGFWQFSQWCFNPNTARVVMDACYQARDPLDLAIIAAAIVGALIGFLWYNTSPAQIFMGDTGSLALGGGLAALAVLSRTELLLVLIGGIFVIEVGTVIINRTYFKATRRIYGTPRRIFRASPLHHHFEMLGWGEVTVVVRFWLISALFVGAAVGLFYLEWVTGTP